MTEQLKPCPCCGSTDVGASQGIVICYVCHVQIKKHATEIAMEIWNNRPYENQIKADAIYKMVHDLLSNPDNPNLAREGYISTKEVCEYAEKLKRDEI